MELDGIVAQAGSSQDYKTGTWRQGKKPQWDPKKCQQCFICFHHCPENCFLLKNGKIAGINHDYCKGCGICQEVCPFNALEMVEEEE